MEFLQDFRNGCLIRCYKICTRIDNDKPSVESNERFTRLGTGGDNSAGEVVWLSVHETVQRTCNDFMTSVKRVAINIYKGNDDCKGNGNSEYGRVSHNAYTRRHTAFQ